MKERTYWVKVDKCSGKDFWYKDSIGKEFEVMDNWNDGTRFKHTTHFGVCGNEGKMISKEDAHVVQKTFWVKVLRASSPWFWYSHLTGQKYEVVDHPEHKEQYRCVDPELVGCLIMKTDAVQVEEPMEYKDLKDWADKEKYAFGTKIWYDDNEECVIMGVKEGDVIVLDVKHDTWDAGHIDGYNLFYMDKEDIIWELPTTMTHDLVESLLQDAGFLKGKLVIKG